MTRALTAEVQTVSSRWNYTYCSMPIIGRQAPIQFATLSVITTCGSITAGPGYSVAGVVASAV